MYMRYGTIGHLFGTESPSCIVNSERPPVTYYNTIRHTGVGEENNSDHPCISKLFFIQSFYDLRRVILLRSKELGFQVNFTVVQYHYVTKHGRNVR